MKILVASDMEGVTGVVNWDQVTPGHAEYARFRELLTDDVNAAVRGASSAGADEILVVDGHWAGANILIERLDARARLVAGSPSPFSMMQGIDRTFDGVLFVGYHARSGTPAAVLDHTWSSLSVVNLWLNGMLTGEYGLNAALAGHFGVPILMVSGDQSACAQVQALVGPLETAVVKHALGRFAAECLPPHTAQGLIEAAAARGVERLARRTAAPPFVLEAPVRVRVEFFASHMADQAALLPGAERSGSCIELAAADMPGAYNAFRAAIALAQ
jgi:D-amino peptidase